jgi:hypothetical protein
MLDRDKEKEENNRLGDQRRKNQEEAKEAIIGTQQFITQNRWRGLGVIFNPPITYQTTSTCRRRSDNYCSSN